MTIQKSIEIINHDSARNKCGKLALVIYFKPTVDFIDYLSQNNDQHLPIQYDNKVYYVVVDKLNTIPYILIPRKLVNKPLGVPLAATTNSIPTTGTVQLKLVIAKATPRIIEPI